MSRHAARRILDVAVATAVLIAAASSALADGKIFSPVAQVRIPDQSAVIGFDGKTELLVIDTAFDGQGDDFAWVVPLPAPPKVRKSTRGLVPTLRMICRPRLARVGVQRRSILFLSTIAAMLWVVMLTRPGIRQIIGIAVLWALLGLFLAHSGTSVTMALREGTQSFGAEVIHRERVGAYDVVTLSAKNAKQLLAWLEESRFKTDPAIGPVLDAYAKEGWIFVAYKFHADAGKDRRAHPLAFTFAAKEAVYPLRLTGVGNGDLKLDLFVLGDREAVIDGMERKRAAWLHFSDDEDYPWSGSAFYGSTPDFDDSVPVAHAEFDSLSKPYKFLTKLVARFTPERMRRDLTIEWKDPVPYRRILYRSEAVRRLSLYRAVWTVLILSALCYLVPIFRARPARIVKTLRVRWLALAPLLVVPVALWLIFWKAWPRSDANAFAAFLGAIVAVLLAYVLGRVKGRVPAWVCAQMYFVGAAAAPVLICLAFTTRPGRMRWSVFVSCAFAAVVLIVGGLVALHGRDPQKVVSPSVRRNLLRFGLIPCLVAAIAVAIAVYLSLVGSIAVAGEVRDIGHDTSLLWDSRLTGRLETDKGSPWLSPVADLRAAVAEDRKRRPGQWTNPFTGKPMKEEDSPGNYTFGRVGKYTVLYIHDVNGARVPVGAFHRFRHKHREANTKSAP